MSTTAADSGPVLRSIITSPPDWVGTVMTEAVGS